MKKTLIVLSLLLLCGTGYFTYQKWYNQDTLSVWSFVPSSTLAVYESNNPLEAFKEISETELWINLQTIHQVKTIQESLQAFDTLAGNNSFSNYFSENHFLASLNKISSEDFDFLYMVEINSLSQHTFLSKALTEYKKLGFQSRTRKYLDFTITDITNSNRQKTFTYIYYQNFFICSFTAFLVEDAVRSVSGDKFKNFEQQNPELKMLTKLKLDQGNLYLNTSQFSTFLNTLSNTNSKFNLAKSSYLDVSIDTKTATLSGFSITDEPTHFLSVFNGNVSGSFLMKEIIPNESAYLNHISITDPMLLSKNLNNYFRIFDSSVADKRQALLSKLDFDVEYTFQLIDQEIAVVTMEQTRDTQLDRFLIFKASDMGETLKYFNSVDERRSINSSDTVFVEQYGEYEIRLLPAKDFGYALLGKLGEGFDESYYLTYRNYIIFSNNLQRLKTLTFSIENESTWNKSLETNNFLAQIDQAANYSLIINTPRSWSSLLQSFKPNWLEHFEKYSFTYKNLEYLSFQFSNVDDKYYTNFTIHQPELPTSKLPSEIKTKESISLSDYANSKPYLVTNHVNKTKELIIQDSSNTLYLLSDQFSFLWSKTLTDKIISPISQIDYYKNSKLQYLFATDRAVHIIDRNGEYLPGFPKNLDGNPRIKHLTLIDYKNTRDYRFAITDDNKNLYLTNKNLKPLGDWGPKAFSSQIQVPFRHIRIGSTDFMITLLEEGKLYVQNRKGNNRDGFPLSFGVGTSDYFIKTSNNIKESSIVLVTNNGELIEISMDSRLLQRDQLYKPATQTTFKIIPDITNESFVILRKTENKYEFLNEKGEELFSKDYLANKPISIQYYRLGGDNNYVVIVDPNGSYMYIYDLAGNLITGRPLASSQAISLMKFGKELRIYRALDRNVELISIKF